LPAGARRARRCWSASLSSAPSPGASVAAAWRRSLTPPRTRCARSSPTTSSRAQRSSPTAGGRAYPPATDGLYPHEPLPGASGAEASKLLPGVHKVASLAKRWLLGTHQGSVDEAHLPSYLNEFVFRFNRRRSRSRGLVFYRVLQLATAHDPVRYRDLIANPRPGRQRRPPPGTRGNPPSLERPPAGRPWRT